MLPGDAGGGPDGALVERQDRVEAAAHEEGEEGDDDGDGDSEEHGPGDADPEAPSTR